MDVVTPPKTLDKHVVQLAGDITMLAVAIGGIIATVAVIMKEHGSAG